MATTNTHKTKSKAAQAPVPKDVNDCAAQITLLGRLMRQHTIAKAAVDEQVAIIINSAAPELAELQANIKLVHDGIQIFAEGHRHELTSGNKTKTANLTTGEITWRQRPPSVTVRNAQAVVDTLKALGLSDYVRVEETVNKQAILDLDSAVSRLSKAELSESSGQALAHARRLIDHAELIATIAGISITKGVEDFAVVPFETISAEPMPAATGSQI